MTLFLGSINLPEWPHRTQENVLLRLPVYYKWCNSGKARWKTGIGQVMGKGAELLCPLWVLYTIPKCPCISTIQKFSEPCPCGLLYMSTNDWLHHWPLAKDLTSKVRKVQLKSSDLLITCCISWQSETLLRRLSKSHLITINSGVAERRLLWISVSSLLLKKLKGFRSSRSEADKDQIHISY